MKTSDYRESILSFGSSLSVMNCLYSVGGDRDEQQ